MPPDFLHSGHGMPEIFLVLQSSSSRSTRDHVALELVYALQRIDNFKRIYLIPDATKGASLAGSSVVPKYGSLLAFAARSSSFIRSVSQVSISIRLSLRSKQGLIFPSDVTRRRVQLAQSFGIVHGPHHLHLRSIHDVFFRRCICRVRTRSARVASPRLMASLLPESP
jgi:hypothetical protein